MKKRIIILMTTLLLAISVCVGCGAENTATEKTEITTEVKTEEKTSDSAEEVTSEENTVQKKETSTEPSEEVTTEATEQVETTELEKAETSTSEPQAEYTYTDISATMYAQQTVNVRDLPDTKGNKVGSLSTNDEIAISGQCNETGWYRFEYNGGVAYVSDKYIDKNKVEMQQQASTDNSGSSSAASNSCPYTLWQPVDNGDSITWYVTQPDPNWEGEHRATQAWMFRTIESRCSQGYWSDQTEWTFMGTYAEGNVYRQTIGIIEYNW